MGTNVNLMLHVRCITNISVLVQEYGTAGRNDDASDRFLLVNESKGNQRRIFWTTTCSIDELECQKSNYVAAWKWVYSVNKGQCLKQSL